MGVSFPLLVIVLGLLVCLSRVAPAGHSGWPVKIFVLFLGGHGVTPSTFYRDGRDSADIFRKLSECLLGVSSRTSPSRVWQ